MVSFVVSGSPLSSTVIPSTKPSSETIDVALAFVANGTVEEYTVSVPS